jgi:NADPH-dependent glutamate synthase beta subunit-like oxidoreductase
MRMNGEDFTNEGNTLLQTERIAARLAGMGVDYISVSAGERFEDAAPPEPNFPPFAGTGYSGYRMSPRWWNKDGVHVYLAEGIRKAVRAVGYDIPIVSAGKIRTPDHAEEIIENEQADIVGMARGLLCDPDWPIKAKEGRAGDIVKCAACGYCSESDERYEIVNCIQWPKGTQNAPEPWLFTPPCSEACPAGVDIREYIDYIMQGQYEKALVTIKDRIPFPGVIGRVCTRFCESKCNRGSMDESIAINALKRFAADSVAARGGDKIPPPTRSLDESVAVIGSGPAGLTAAYHLVQLGYGVTIFEKADVAGGMLALGIPEYRLPRKILQSEIEDIQKMGVDIRLNAPVGKEGLTIEELHDMGYKALFIAVGVHKGVKLDIPKVDIESVLNGTEWLKEINSGKDVKVGERVVVIGGGNVAIDSARMALRLGAKEVSIAYRRSADEMPAIKDEVAEAIKEGIEIRYMSSPCRIVCEGDECKGLECFETELGEPDESGRRRPIQIEGSEFLLDADMVLLAIGEVPDLAFLDGNNLEIGSNNTIKVNPHTMATNREWIFAGGDVVTGAATVIEAVAAGRKAALAIDKYLRGKDLEYVEPVMESIPFEDVDVDMFRSRKRKMMPTLPPKKRIKGLKEVELGFQTIDALTEADRCLQCGMFPKK